MCNVKIKTGQLDLQTKRSKIFYFRQEHTIKLSNCKFLSKTDSELQVILQTASDLLNKTLQ